MRTLLLVVAILAVTCLGAGADIIEYNWASGNQGAGASNSWSATTNTIFKFDTSLGTLNSVRISLDTGLFALAGMENLAANVPHAITTNANATITLVLPDHPSLQTTPNATAPFNATKYDGNTNYSGGSGNTISNMLDSKTIDWFVNPVNFGAYEDIWGSALNLNIGGLAAISFTGQDAAHFATDPANHIQSFGDVKVVYDYTPVPEPGSLALLLLGLPMAGVWYRRKRAA